MARIDVAEVMDAIYDVLHAEEDPLLARVFAWPVLKPTPPCAIVGYPEALDFDVTFRDGSDKAVFPVWMVCGFAHDRTARDTLSSYITGATGIKDALDGNLGGVVQTCRVVDCQVEVTNIGGVDYLTAKFSLEVYS